MNFMMRSASTHSAAFPILAALAFVTLLWSPAAATGLQIFIDVNDNGVFDGDDVDVTETVHDIGLVVTPASLVVPEGAYLRLTSDSVSLRAGKAIHVAGQVSTSGSLFLRTETGPITVGPRSLVVADGTVQLTASGDVVIDRSRVQGYGEAMLESIDGQLLVNGGVLSGGNRLELNGFAAAGGLSMHGTTLLSARGIINVHVDGAVQMQQTKMSARDVNLTVAGGSAEVWQSAIRVPRTGSITMSVDPAPALLLSAAAPAATSVLDLRGTRLYAPAENIVLVADEVFGY